MRMKISDDMLYVALEEIKKISKDNKLPKEYDGYAASFGPAIITSGLLPAVAFYSDCKKKKRLKLMRIVAKVSGLINDPTYGMHAEKNDGKDLLMFIVKHRDNPEKMLEIKKKVLQATVAIKLAMRNYQHTDSETENT